MKTTYTCSLCDMDFDNFDACLRHEKEAHAKPQPYSEIEAICYGEASYYPDELVVTMTDGATILYVHDHVLKCPEEPQDKEKAPLEG